VIDGVGDFWSMCIDGCSGSAGLFCAPALCSLQFLDDVCSYKVKESGSDMFTPFIKLIGVARISTSEVALG
jgi:hypothetical protein